MPETKTNEPYASLNLQIVKAPENETEARKHIVNFLYVSRKTPLGLCMIAMIHAYNKLWAKDMSIGTFLDWTQSLCVDLLKHIDKITNAKTYIYAHLAIEKEQGLKQIRQALICFVDSGTIEDFDAWIATEATRTLEEIAIGRATPRGWHFTDENLKALDCERLNNRIHDVFQSWLDDSSSTKAINKGLDKFFQNRTTPTTINAYFDSE